MKIIPTFGRNSRRNIEFCPSVEDLPKIISPSAYVVPGWYTSAYTVPNWSTSAYTVPTWQTSPWVVR